MSLRTAPRQAQEGYLPVPGGMVWYRRVPGGGGLPLVVLHGGPGAGSDYLRALEKLAVDRPVVLYDQLGCGRSEAPDDPSLWTLDRFLLELRFVRRALRLRRFHLYGHSWGGWLALEYMVRHGQGVQGLVLASTSASMAQHERELARLIETLPAPVAEALRRHGAEGAYDHPDYRAAVLHFYQRHLCAMEEWPDELVSVMTQQRENAAYRKLLGPNELTVTGSLASWDRAADLRRIDVPALVTVGRADEITPACATALHRGLPDSRLVIFEKSAHMPHLEEPTHYRDVVSAFLRSCDGPPPTR